MKLWQVITLLVLAALVTVSCVFFFSRPVDAFPPGTQQLPYLFSIAADPGIDAGTDIFRLGQVAPGGGSWRMLAIQSSVSSITNEAQLTRRVLIIARGEGSAWLVFEPGVLDLPGEVKISLKPPHDAPFGRYEGIIYVIPYNP